MRRLKYLVAATLDGRIARLDSSFDFFAAAGDAHHADYLASLRAFDAVLMGRKTDEVGTAMGVTDLYPFLDSYASSSSLIESPNARARVIGGNPAPWVREFKPARRWRHLSMRRLAVGRNPARSRTDR